MIKKLHWYRYVHPVKALARKLGKRGFIPPPVQFELDRRGAFRSFVGHSNFDLTPELADALLRVDGVEGLELFSRYRLRLDVGMLFVPRGVLRRVAEVAGAVDVDAALVMVEYLEGRGGMHWLVGRMPDGKLKVASAPTPGEVQSLSPWSVQADEVYSSWSTNTNGTLPS